MQVKIGDNVKANLPRGGHVTGVIERIDRTSAFARAYGPQAKLSCGYTVGTHDVCEVLPGREAYLQHGNWGGPYWTERVALTERTAGRKGKTMSGYGSRIPTDFMVLANDHWHRVYCVCYSNAGTLYVNLRDGDWSRRQHEAQCEAWANASIRDRVKWIQRCFGMRCNIFAARRDELPECDNDSLRMALIGE